MEGQIIIENQTERHIQYRIDHQTVCVKAGKCFCKQGRRGLVAGSVHVPGGKGKRSVPLHPAMALIPELKRDLAGRKPKVKLIGHEPTAKKAAPKAAEKDSKQEQPPKSKKGRGGETGQK